MIATPAHLRTTLQEAALGQAVRVADVQGPQATVDRLRALGFCVGQTVRVVQRGNPAIVEVLGTRIGMSPEVARLVHVG